MNSTLGQALVLLGLGLAAAGSVLGFVSGRSRSNDGLRWTRRLAAGFAWAMILANGVMIKALLEHDFTVRYVDQVGSTSTPTHITIVSLWSALEGSILFWGLILGLYTLGFLRSMRDRHQDMVPYSLGTLLATAAFFCFLIAGPADPFAAVTPRPDAMHTGSNPLLQNHLLMIIHPPMLYLGYVGMSVPFSMGVAALIRGRLTSGWMRPIRLWMLVPFAFLTCGIVLGGWWAYEVLGWGGYWAWDPVENASFLPWLTAAAFLHAGMLGERRGLLKGWTLILLLITFALTILGTFMTRSGVFNSVHSFTQSAIGPTFLVFLGIVLVASVVLVSLRLHLLEDDGGFRSPLSRDAAFVLNNLLFVSFAFTVLVGTIFPLLAEAIRDVKLSVGAPFFNQLTVPIGVAIVFLMGVGPALPWGRSTGEEAARVLALPLGLGLAATAVGAVCGVTALWPALTLFVSGFATSVAARDMWVPIRSRKQTLNSGWIEAMADAFRRGRRRYGGQIVHIGVALMAVSIGVSSSYQVSTEGVLKSGEALAVGDYQVRYVESRSFQEPHRSVVEVQFDVIRAGKTLSSLRPSLNRYSGQMSPIGTPAVLSFPHEDLYLSLMSVDPGGRFAGLRAYVNPLVVWIWVATGVMLFGTLIAAWPSRRPMALEESGPLRGEDEETAA